MYPFLILDVFATDRYTGNQLAVVLNAAEMPGEQMQKVAREFNFQETTFVVGQVEAGHHVRIFTPREELRFAGHPTLGTAFALAYRRETSSASTREWLQLPVGRVPVDVHPDGDRCNGRAWMQPPEVTLGEPLSAASIAPALGLSADDLNPELPVVSAAIGIDFVMVPAASLDALRRIRLQPAVYRELVAQGIPPNVHAFCRADVDSGYDFVARVIWLEGQSMKEDAATGSATSCLAHYLLSNEFFDKDNWHVRIQQGDMMGRPSLLEVRHESVDDTSRIRVGGRVQLVAEGVLR